MIAVVFLLSTVTPTIWQEDVPTYEELVDQAAFNCKNTDRRHADEKILWTLVEAEQKYNVPEEMRGILLAQACGESGFNPNARGDYRNKRPRAIGLFQMWHWWVKAYKIDRADPSQAADAHMKHILRVLTKVKKRCRWQSPEKQWIAAWVASIRAPKKGGRCHEKPKHLRILKRWYRNIEKERKLLRDEYCEEPCGC
jgi:hypothetical protein